MSDERQSARLRGETGGLWAAALSASPQPLRGDCRALDHRTQLLEGNVGVDLAVSGKGAKPAIGARDHPLTADDVGKLADALGDKLRMLDIIGRGVEHARDQDLVVGQFYALPHR